MCTTDGISSIADTPLEVTLSLITGETATCTTAPSNCEFTFATAQTPTVTSISQNSGVYGDVIILNGQNFGIAMSVTLSGSSIPILYSDASSIQFSVPNLVSSEYLLNVTDTTQGPVALNINQYFTVLVSISSVTPTEGSVNGAIFSILGSGFGSPIVNGGSCIVENFTTTSISCRLYADLSNYSSVPFVVSSIYQGQTSSGTWSSYTPESSLTPLITSMVMSGDPNVTASFDLTFTGSQLDLSSQKEVILVSTSNSSVTCRQSISSASASSFQVSFTSTPADSFEVLVHLDSIGFAAYDPSVSNHITITIALQSNVAFQQLICWRKHLHINSDWS